MKALEQNKSFNKNDAVTYHVVDVAGRRSMAEDIWGGVSTAISRRRGMPDDHVEGGHVKGGHVMPFQACGGGDESRLPAGQPKSRTESCYRMCAQCMN